MYATKNFRAPRQLTLLDFCPQLDQPSQDWDELVEKIEEKMVEEVKAAQPTPPTPTPEVSTKTLRNRRKRAAAKARKVEQQKKQKKGWNTTTKPTVKKAKKVSPVPKPAPLKTKRESPRERPVHENTTLILKNLPYDDTYNVDLQDIFERYGAIQFINILRDEDKRCKGIAFIRYETKKGSDNALADMDHFWYNDRCISVEYARDRRNN